jgi:hypothetical protein
MPYEYLVVLFPRSRRVKVNGKLMGRTNTRLELERGEYDISLGPPENYTPAQQTVDLRDTAPLTPMMVEFKEAR